MNKSYSPKIRENGLMTTKVGDELVVYDSNTNEASCLDPMTTVVWEACDGNNDLTRVLDHVQSSGFPKANIALIWNAIDRLDQAELLEDQPISGEQDTNKRRELFRMLSAGAIGTLPLISTVLVQPAMAQMSGPCQGPGRCDPDGIPCCPPRICRRNRNGNGPYRCRPPL